MRPPVVVAIAVVFAASFHELTEEVFEGEAVDFDHAVSAWMHDLHRPATILRDPTTDDHGEDYGAIRSYEALDLEGHHWWFMRVTRDPKSA